MPATQDTTVSKLVASGNYWGKIVRPLPGTNYLITGERDGGLVAISLPGSPTVVLPGNTRVHVLTGLKLLEYITSHEDELERYYSQMPGLRDALEMDALT